MTLTLTTLTILSAGKHHQEHTRLPRWMKLSWKWTARKVTLDTFTEETTASLILPEPDMLYLRTYTYFLLDVD